MFFARLFQIAIIAAAFVSAQDKDVTKADPPALINLDKVPDVCTGNAGCVASSKLPPLVPENAADLCNETVMTNYEACAKCIVGGALFGVFDNDEGLNRAQISLDRMFNICTTAQRTVKRIEVRLLLP